MEKENNQGFLRKTAIPIALICGIFLGNHFSKKEEDTKISDMISKKINSEFSRRINLREELSNIEKEQQQVRQDLVDKLAPFQRTESTEDEFKRRLFELRQDQKDLKKDVDNSIVHVTEDDNKISLGAISSKLDTLIQKQHESSLDFAHKYKFALVDNNTEIPFIFNQKIIDKASEITKDLSSDETKARVILDYFNSNIDYDFIGLLGKNRYRKSDEVFSRKSGLCGEQASLYVVMARSVGLESNLVLVHRNFLGDKTKHGCASVRLDRKDVLVDPTLEKEGFDVKHKEFEIVSDDKAIEHYIFVQDDDIRLDYIKKKLKNKICNLDNELMRKLGFEYKVEDLFDYDETIDFYETIPLASEYLKLGIKYSMPKVMVEFNETYKMISKVEKERIKYYNLVLDTLFDSVVENNIKNSNDITLETYISCLKKVGIKPFEQYYNNFMEKTIRFNDQALILSKHLKLEEIYNKFIEYENNNPNPTEDFIKFKIAIKYLIDNPSEVGLLGENPELITKMSSELRKNYDNYKQDGTMSGDFAPIKDIITGKINLEQNP